MITNGTNIFIEFVNYIFFIGFTVNKKFMCGGICIFLTLGVYNNFKFHIEPQHIYRLEIGHIWYFTEVIFGIPK